MAEAAEKDMKGALVSSAADGLACRLEGDPTAADRARLDAFLVDCPGASYMQRVCWPELVPLSRLQHFRFLWCENAGELLLGGVVRFTRLFPGRYLAVFPRGPVFRRSADLERALPSILEVLRRAGACTVLMHPNREGDDAEAVSRVLTSHGFQQVERSDQSMYPVTGYIDLTRSEEDILAGFKYRCRRHIRGAERQGLRVRAADSEADVVRFQSILDEFVATKVLDVAGQPGLVEQWRFVQEHGGTFLLAEVDDQLIGGHVAFREGPRAVWVTLASTPVLPKLPRSYNLLWEAMRVMKAQGCREFDLAGVPYEDDEDAGKQKRQFFKAAFNPRIAHLVPIHAAVLRPLSHALLFRARQAYRRSALKHRLAPLLWR